jgi:hypothetical protein
MTENVLMKGTEIFFLIIYISEEYEFYKYIEKFQVPKGRKLILY